MTEKGKQSESKFALHAEADSALAPKTESEETPKKKSMAMAGKIQLLKDHQQVQDYSPFRAH